jgi:hypothetical protein
MALDSGAFPAGAHGSGIRRGSAPALDGAFASLLPDGERRHHARLSYARDPIRTRVTGARRRRVLPRGDRSSWPGQAGAKHLDPLAGMIVPEAIVIEDLEEPDERQNAE